MTDLDEVRAVLADVPPMSDASFAAVRERVLAPAPAVARGRRWPLGVVAAGLVLAAVVGAVSFPAPDASASAVLTRAADVTVIDAVPGPGEFLHTVSVSRDLAVDDRSGQRLRYYARSVTEMWRPADWRGRTWFSRNAVGGDVEWVEGDDEAARSVGVTPEAPGFVADDAPCGWTGREFGGAEGDSCSTVSWWILTDSFVESLPTDPDALRAVLTDPARHDTPVGVVADVLSTGSASPELRAALYRALAGLPQVEITDGAANLDGQTGIAFASGDDRMRREIVIDPDDGRFLGERLVSTAEWEGLPAGTVWSSTAVRSEITTTGP